ncbi:MAG: hypothetical protein AAFP26_03740 [Planctomycetota bacterium]
MTPDRSVIDYALACGGCGYALLGSRRDGVCAECGRAVRDSMRVDGPRRATMPACCPSCRYDLAEGYSGRGRCPECGWSPDPIEAFGLDRLARVRRGATLVVASSIALPICLVLWPFAPLALALMRVAGGCWPIRGPRGVRCCWRGRCGCSRCSRC